LLDNISDKLQSVLRKLRGKGKITPADIKETMREVKLALLEADVNFKVVKDFINKVSEQSLGEEVLNNISGGQMVVKIVADELALMLGGAEVPLNLSGTLPSIILMCGLQGSGKTTTTVKLAVTIRKKGKNPLLIAADVYRAAAITQLKAVAKSVDIPVFCIDNETDVVKIVKQGIDYAKQNNHDCVIIDTAGRLQVDDVLMHELEDIKSSVPVAETLLVVDSMVGQEAVSVASEFDSRLNLSGVILTKLDGDARGGAAMSIAAVVGKPIKYIGLGEKTSDLEPFYPDRMARRILGMGDILSLVDKAQDAFDQKESEEMAKRLLNNTFTFDDFANQLNQMQKMGDMKQILSMIPGVDKKTLSAVNIDDNRLTKINAIIQSMTPEERNKPSIINGSRRERIAKGSANRVQDVNSLLNQFNQMKKMMGSFTKGKKGKKGKGMFGGMGGMNGLSGLGGMGGLPFK
jgi:signal recognition particle subunit SRP54